MALRTIWYVAERLLFLLVVVVGYHISRRPGARCLPSYCGPRMHRKISPGANRSNHPSCILSPWGFFLRMNYNTTNINRIELGRFHHPLRRRFLFLTGLTDLGIPPKLHGSVSSTTCPLRLLCSPRSATWRFNWNSIVWWSGHSLWTIA